MWGQNHLMESADSGNRGEDECRQLKERLHSFMSSMRYFVSGDVNGTVIALFLFYVFVNVTYLTFLYIIFVNVILAFSTYFKRRSI